MRRYVAAVAMLGAVAAACGTSTTPHSNSTGGSPPNNSTTTTAPTTVTTHVATVGDKVPFGSNGANITLQAAGPVALGGGEQANYSITVLGCAGTAPTSFSPEIFSLTLADFSRVSDFVTGQQNELKGAQLTPGDCEKGAAFFVVPGGQKVTNVTASEIAGGGTAKWSIP